MVLYSLCSATFLNGTFSSLQYSGQQQNPSSDTKVRQILNLSHAQILANKFQENHCDTSRLRVLANRI